MFNIYTECASLAAMASGPLKFAFSSDTCFHNFLGLFDFGWFLLAFLRIPDLTDWPLGISGENGGISM